MSEIIEGALSALRNTMARQLIANYAAPASGGTGQRDEFQTLINGALRLREGYLIWFAGLQGCATPEALMELLQAHIQIRDQREDSLALVEWCNIGEALADTALIQACRGGGYDPDVWADLDLVEGTYQPDKLPAWVASPPFEFIQTIEVVPPVELRRLCSVWAGYEASLTYEDGECDAWELVTSSPIPELLPAGVVEWFVDCEITIPQVEWAAFREWWLGLQAAVKALAERDSQEVRFVYED